MTDVIVGKGEILVNRKESAKAVIEKQEGLLIVDTASRATVLSADSIGGMLIVENRMNLPLIDLSCSNWFL